MDPSQWRISVMKNVYTKIETCIRGLRSLGNMEDSYRDLLVPIIFDKVSTNFKTHVAMEITHGISTS